MTSANKLAHGELVQFINALNEDRSQFKSIKPEVIFRRVLKIGEKMGLDEVYNGLQTQAIAVGKLSEMQRRVISSKYLGEVIAFTATDADWFQLAIEREPIKDSNEKALNFVATVRDDVNHVIYKRLIGVIARERTGSGIQGVFRTVSDICDEIQIEVPSTTTDPVAEIPEAPATEPAKEEAEAVTEEPVPEQPSQESVEEAIPDSPDEPAPEVPQEPEAPAEQVTEEAHAVEALTPELRKELEDMGISENDIKAIEDGKVDVRTVIKLHEDEVAAAEEQRQAELARQEAEAKEAEKMNKVVIQKGETVLFKRDGEEVIITTTNGDEITRVTDPNPALLPTEKFVADDDIRVRDLKEAEEYFCLFSIVEEAPKEEKKEEKEVKTSTAAEIGTQIVYCGHLLNADLVSTVEAKRGALYIIDEDNSLIAYNGIEWVIIDGDDADEIFRQIKTHEEKAIVDIDSTTEKTDEPTTPEEPKEEDDLPPSIGDIPEFKHCKDEHTKGEYLEMLFKTPAPTILHVLNYIRENDDSESFKLTGTHAIEQMYVYSDYTFSIIRMKNGCFYRIFVAHTDMSLGDSMTWLNSHEDRNRWYAIADVSDREINRVMQMRG